MSILTQDTFIATMRSNCRLRLAWSEPRRCRVIPISAFLFADTEGWHASAVSASSTSDISNERPVRPVLIGTNSLPALPVWR